MEKFNSFAVLILAAGSSSRLGQAKQLVLYENQTLLENACEKALDVSSNVFVVLGASKDECVEKIKDLKVNTIINNEYKTGLSSSIRIGIEKLFLYDKVLIMLCDQPFIPKKHFEKLVENSVNNAKIICSLYNTKLSVPAIFPKKYFNLLLSLSGDKGAKKIIENNEHLAIELEDIHSFDIDTNEDLEKLNSKVLF
ncbi:nucleotidyltransferase family protein [Arcobacteraceae bacterium]|nr:nucleotidyltransferase family protein [Arcobacteraceae bacterium]